MPTAPCCRGVAFVRQDSGVFLKMALARGWTPPAFCPECLQEGGFPGGRGPTPVHPEPPGPDQARGAQGYRRRPPPHYPEGGWSARRLSNGAPYSRPMTVNECLATDSIRTSKMNA